MSIRPVTDLWICARPKVKRYGSYPSGFLSRARALLGVQITHPVLHLPGGAIRDYPFYGLGPNDKTVDLDPSVNPDFCFDVREIGVNPGDIYPFPSGMQVDVGPNGLQLAPYELWSAVLIDLPYTEDDAEEYPPGSSTFPEIGDILKRALTLVPPGGRVGVLDYVCPRPPKDALFTALVAVSTGFGQRMRAYSVFERPSEWSRAAAKRAAKAVRGQT